MTESSSLSVLMDRYKILIRYCDEFFAATLQNFPTQIWCSTGCASCCILETVMPLEAYAISLYLESQPPLFKKSLYQQSNCPTKGCIFLVKEMCAIYPARPIICRTHGLPIYYQDSQEIDVCPINFTEVDISTIDRKFLLDIKSVTVNLIRLNLAYCRIINQPESAGDRVPLHSLL